jgi:hypothetical protein
MTRKSRLALSAAVLVSVPLAALAQQQQRPMPMGTPGVTQPLTPDQIARENPPNALSGAGRSEVCKQTASDAVDLAKETADELRRTAAETIDSATQKIEGPTEA